MPIKVKVIDTWAAETLAAGLHYGPAVEVPRGAQNIQFTSEMTVLDETAGDEDYTFGIQHRADPSHSWVPVPELAFTQVTGDIGVDETQYEQKPTAANAANLNIRKYVRSMVLTAGTTPVVTGNIRMAYTSPRGPGIVVDHNVIS
jgi:hypothetical protein